jgi:hypothetical protein
MEERQLWNMGKPTTASPTEPHCTPFTLPSNGVLTLGVSSVLTLTSDAVFKPECTGSTDIILTGTGAPTSFTDFRDPFYASTLPECYALAATTVIAYMLVIMLLITPRTFLQEGAVVLGRRGFTNGPSGSDAGIGIGGRPWLQKVAALTVAVSLTIATADTFRVAERQYEQGYQDAQALQNEVENGLELKIIRVISDTFLWLAQAQTLIRLFPRQREKVIIKWTAFALIILDVLFSLLNDFVYDGDSRPRSFVDAVPALSYLFQLALSLLYCAWVIYYAITKRRFAFYHSQMRNICLVALLSLFSVLVPVVFFVLDISKPSLAGWGDYVRWVGAAAASVGVWEWVERIEALERNDKKDDVLGREVFDGDEMLDVTPSSDFMWAQHNLNRKDQGKGGGGTATGANGISWPGMAGIASRYRPRATHDVEDNRTWAAGNTQNPGKRPARPRPPLWPTRPLDAATPLSRTDTASAESTVYSIRYHPISEATPPTRENGRPTRVSRTNSLEVTNAGSLHGDGSDSAATPTIIEQMTQGHEGNEIQDHRPNPFHTLAKANPFRRKVQEPPPEVSAHSVRPEEPLGGHSGSSRRDLRARLEEFAETQADKFREKTRPSVNVGSLPVTVIPAPTRRRDLAAALEELEDAESGQATLGTSVGLNSLPSTILNRRAEDLESARLSRPERLGDPYTPDDLNGHSILQRGTISFITSVQQDRGRRIEEGHEFLSPVSPESPLEEPLSRNSLLSSRSSHIQSRTPTSPRRDGLPVLSIPALPRHPRSDD